MIDNVWSDPTLVRKGPGSFTPNGKMTSAATGLTPLSTKRLTKETPPPSPTRRSLVSRRNSIELKGVKLACMKSGEEQKKDIYLVTCGRNIGAFKSWPECQSQVTKYPNAKYSKERMNEGEVVTFFENLLRKKPTSVPEPRTEFFPPFPEGWGKVCHSAPHIIKSAACADYTGLLSKSNIGQLAVIFGAVVLIERETNNVDDGLIASISKKLHPKVTEVIAHGVADAIQNLFFTLNSFPAGEDSSYALYLKAAHNVLYNWFTSKIKDLPTEAPTTSTTSECQSQPVDARTDHKVFVATPPQITNIDILASLEIPKRKKTKRNVRTGK